MKKKKTLGNGFFTTKNNGGRVGRHVASIFI
jgi:hypothetical protein